MCPRVTLGFSRHARIFRMTIGERVLTLREEAGMTQSELAAIVGVSRSMIARIETNTKKPGRDTAKKLASAFNRSIEYILEGKNPGLLTKSDEETALLERYRRASAQRRGAVLILLGDDDGPAGDG